MSDYLLITGMSGAGRSTAAAALEDAGWYVIDNMPPSLLSEVADVVGRPGSIQERVALVIGRGGGARVDGGRRGGTGRAQVGGAESGAAHHQPGGGNGSQGALWSPHEVNPSPTFVR